MPDSKDPMDCSPPGSSVHGIFQAKVLEWGAVAFSESDTTWFKAAKEHNKVDGDKNHSLKKKIRKCPNLCKLPYIAETDCLLM